MYSKKTITSRGNNLSASTSKNFKVTKEDLKYLRNYPAPSIIRMIARANKKRARRLNYNLVMGFEE